MKENWTLLILLCLCWVVVWFLAFAAWGQIVYSQEQHDRMALCADLAEFQGQHDDAGAIRVHLVVTGGPIYTDQELKERRFWTDGFMRGFAAGRNVKPLDMADAWYKEQRCAELIQSLRNDTIN